MTATHTTGPAGEPGLSLRVESSWPALTVALKDPRSPVRTFLEQRFPNTRELQRRYRADVGPLVVAGVAHPGTLGGAFDWMTRFLLYPRPDLHLALVGARNGHPRLEEVLDELAATLGFATDADEGAVGDRFDGPVPGSVTNVELLARGCWALTLLTELFRVGMMPGSPLANLDLRRVTGPQLLALASTEAVRELLELRHHTEQVLVPDLSARRGPWALGPTFAGSRVMNADADLVASGLLLELKTNLGTKRADGTRQASLDGQTLLQLLGYVLLDFPDEFAIAEVGIYNGRYAHLAVWPLPELLAELAGRPVDLTAERAAFRALLVSGVRVRRA